MADLRVRDRVISDAGGPFLPCLMSMIRDCVPPLVTVRRGLRGSRRAFLGVRPALSFLCGLIMSVWV